MKKITLFIGLLLFTFQSEAVIQTHAVETAEVQGISLLEGEMSKKEMRQALRKERRKMRRASRAEGNRALTLAKLGLASSISSIVFGLTIFGIAAGPFLSPAALIVILGLVILGSFSAILGLVIAGVSFSKIKNGELEKKYIWIPILTMTLGIGISLFWLKYFGPALL